MTIKLPYTTALFSFIAASIAIHERILYVGSFTSTSNQCMRLRNNQIMMSTIRIQYNIAFVFFMFLLLLRPFYSTHLTRYTSHTTTYSTLTLTGLLGPRGGEVERKGTPAGMLQPHAPIVSRRWSFLSVITLSLASTPPSWKEECSNM